MIEIDSSDIIASFDVDAQNCFTPLCPDELPVPGGHTIVEALNRQAELANWRVGSKDAHPTTAVWVANDENPQLSPVNGHVNADLHWNLHAVPGTKGFKLLDGLPSVTEYDYFVWKGVEPDLHPYGACYHDQMDQRSTGVIEFLRDKQARTVLIGGLALDFCVKVTAMQLLKAGFRVIVNLAATRSLIKDEERQVITELQAAGAEFIDGLDDLVFRPLKAMKA